jgi:predicted ATPase
MLQKITLENFKSHQLTELNLDDSRLHALVGQNSSGKTSVLQALHYLCLLAESPFKDIFKHDRSPQFITTIGAEAMSVTASGFWVDENQQHWQASYSFKQRSANDWFPTASLKVDNVDKNEKIKDGTVAGWPSSFQHSAYPIPLNLRHSVYLKLVANNLAKPALSEDIKPRVEYDGSGLAPTLDYLRDEAPDKFEELQEMLKRIVPGVRKVGLKLAKVTVNRQRTIKVDDQSSVPYQETQELTGKEVVLDMNTGKRIPGHAISEGTMLTLGLLTVLMNPNQPNLVLLDDLEQGLHPYAQRELMNALKEILAANPNLQIIFSTHSSYIVDELQPSQVHVLHNSQTGFTVAKRLDEHPDMEWAIESLMTGEFWDSVGEDWVRSSQ